MINLKHKYQEEKNKIMKNSENLLIMIYQLEEDKGYKNKDQEKLYKTLRKKLTTIEEEGRQQLNGILSLIEKNNFKIW